MRRHWLLSLVLLSALAAWFYGITAGALWEPHELSVAELGRRIGLNLLGGKALALPGADNSLPIRADLGRGELPITSAALGFRLFGLSAWAGRLPLMLWGLAGVGAVSAAVSRLWRPRVALYAAIVLSTTPLYFLQARVLLGDAVTLATFAIAWSGLAVACLVDDVSPRARVAFTLLGFVGLYAGFWCRGPLLNVAAPALAVGLAGVTRGPATAGARWVTLASLVLGVLAVALGVSGLSLATQTGEYSVFVGSAIAPPPEPLTFEAALGDLMHAAFPWSAAAPLVLALIARREPASRSRAGVDAAALGLALSLATSAWLWPSFKPPPLPGSACLAVLIAVGLSELEAGALGSPLVGFATAGLGVVIGLDLRANPEKSLSAFAVTGVQLPESLRHAASWLWLGAAGLVALAALLCCYERPEPETERPRFRRAEYGQLLAELQRAWQGNVVFALLLLEAALVGFLLLTAVSERLVPLPQLEGFGTFSRRLVAYGAIAVPLLPLLPLAALGARDTARALFDAGAVTRGQALLVALAAVGGLSSTAFYPQLARQLSPREAFERYHQLARPHEPLGLLGEQRGAGPYQGVPDAESFDSPDEAFAWLDAAAPERRWLVLRHADLASLNAQYRAAHQRNLPVLDARSSEVLLASSRLGARERDENPLASWLLDSPPRIQHPMHALVGGELELLGFSLRTPQGDFAESLVPAQAFRLSLYFRVRGPMPTGAWKTFVHLDGLQRRFNADHDLLEGKYPLRLWQGGDLIADTTEVLLEPNFSPGPYRLYFGLFAGDHRAPVTEGAADEDRIVAGTLQVR